MKRKKITDIRFNILYEYFTCCWKFCGWWGGGGGKAMVCCILASGLTLTLVISLISGANHLVDDILLGQSRPSSRGS